jgi:ankyrin repeat protein
LLYDFKFFRGLQSRRSALVALLLGLLMQTGGPVQAQTPARAELLGSIQRDDAQAVRLALLKGVDVNLRDDAGTPLIVLAAHDQSWRVLQALIDMRSVRLDATNAKGTNALMYAALHGELSIVRRLIERDAQVNKTGWTPLHFAASNGHNEVVSYLLEHHAYIDAESPNLSTPLMMAARMRHDSTARLLLQEGADPTPVNQSGMSAADYARKAGDPALGALLASAAEAFRLKYKLPSKP